VAEQVTGGSGDSLTETLAGYWAGARFEDIPPVVVATAKRFLLDTLAAGIAGADSDVTDAARRGAEATLEHASGSATLWGRNDRMPAAQAAMVNGTAAHALELDDFGGCGHSGAVVIPAVCALAGATRVTGRDALTAMIAGYDVAARVLDGSGGYRPVTQQGWHSTGTCGSFGAAAGAAKLLGLEVDLFTAALGIAGTFTGGIWAFLVDGAMTKRFHPGKAAQTGVEAALLAQAGMTGPRYVLEAEWGGFYATYSPQSAQPALTTAGLGDDFRIMRSGMKPHACCRDMHSALDAAIELVREAGVDSASVVGLRVHGNAQTQRQFSRREVTNLLEAQFSFPYSLAVAVASGRATLDQYRPLRTDDPEVRRLMDVTEIVADRTLEVGRYPSLEIHLADGRRLERDVLYAKGAAENPLTDEELGFKARTLLVPVLGDARCAELMACIAGLEKLDDFGTLNALTTPAKP
jgi:2-methylcitrate dehydratase PrpD